MVWENHVGPSAGHKAMGVPIAVHWFQRLMHPPVRDDDKAVRSNYVLKGLTRQHFVLVTMALFGRGPPAVFVVLGFRCVNLPAAPVFHLLWFMVVKCAPNLYSPISTQ